MRTPFPTDVIPPGEAIQRQPHTSPTRTLQSVRTLLQNKWLKFILRLTCTLLLFAFLFKSISWSSVLAGLHNLDSGQLLIALVLGMSGVIVSSYQWQSLLDGERIHMDLRKLINLYLVGVAFNHFLPTGMGGDVVKAFYINKASHNASGSASAVVMSRVTGFIGMLLVSVPSLIIWHGLFHHDLTILFLLSCLAMCAALTAVLAMVILLPRWTYRWSQQRFLRSIFTVGNTICKSITRPRPMGISIFFGMLFHISAALNYYSLGLLFHVSIPLTFYLVAIPFVSLIAFLPISINGFGLRETAFVYIFSTIHVLPATATLMVLFMDMQILLFGVIGGCIYLTMGERKQHIQHASTNTPAQELSV